MKRNLLLECAWILPRTNNPDLKFVCEGYIDHAYDLFKQNDNTLDRNAFYNTLFKLSEGETSDEEDDDDPFNNDQNRSIKDHDKDSRISPEERRRRKAEYYINSKNPVSRLSNTLSLFL